LLLSQRNEAASVADKFNKFNSSSQTEYNQVKADPKRFHVYNDEIQVEVYE